MSGPAIKGEYLLGTAKILRKVLDTQIGMSSRARAWWIRKRGQGHNQDTYEKLLQGKSTDVQDGSS